MACALRIAALSCAQEPKNTPVAAKAGSPLPGLAFAPRPSTDVTKGGDVVDVERSISSEHLFAQRLRRALFLIAIALVGFAVAEWFWSREHIQSLYALKFVEFTAVLGGRALVGRLQSRSMLAAVALALFAVLSTTAATAGIIVRDPNTVPFVLAILALAAATVLPWRWQEQLVAVCFGTAALALHFWGLQPIPWSALGYGYVTALVAFLASVYVAAELQRFREERERVEAELRAARTAAEQANEAKTRFLANMSHELRTPLNGIIGMTQIALETDLNEEQREYLEIVRMSADTLLALVNDVLDLSRMESGAFALEPIPFSLRERVGEIMKGLAIRAHQKGLELAWRVAPDVPDALVGDPARLQQVLANLVGNAIKFTEVGHVFLEIECQGAPSAQEVILHFAVRDTGVGIPPDRQQHLFEPFESDAEVSGISRTGLGLGLAITRRLVSAMGGTIWYESDPGQGSHFHFTARFAPTATIASTVPQGLPFSTSTKVLLVEPHRITRNVLTEILAGWSLRVAVASTAAEARALLDRAANEAAPYRLVFLSSELPDQSGLALAELMVTTPRYETPHIVLLTDSTAVGDAARARAIGLGPPIIRPPKYDELYRAVVAALSPASRPQSFFRLLHDTAARSPARSGPRRILVAEDNPMNQQLVRRLLEPRGYEVVVVSNGAEAVAALQKHDFDLVLMDLQMPVMDGFTAAQAIRATEPVDRPRVPIVALTAHFLPADQERCLAAGMDGYIPKPIQAQRLVETVEAFLAFGSTAPPAPNGNPPPAAGGPGQSQRGRAHFPSVH